MHDFTDEFEAVKFAEGLWPCAKITRIRKKMEAEQHGL
jgi:hypothetical protein